MTNIFGEIIFAGGFLVFLFLGGISLKSGKAKYRSRVYLRSEEPGSYWYHTISTFVLSAVFPVFGVLFANQARL
jgi:hypothetical protein